MLQAISLFSVSEIILIPSFKTKRYVTLAGINKFIERKSQMIADRE